MWPVEGVLQDLGVWPVEGVIQDLGVCPVEGVIQGLGVWPEEGVIRGLGLWPGEGAIQDVGVWPGEGVIQDVGVWPGEGVIQDLGVWSGEGVIQDLGVWPEEGVIQDLGVWPGERVLQKNKVCVIRRAVSWIRTPDPGRIRNFVGLEDPDQEKSSNSNVYYNSWDPTAAITSTTAESAATGYMSMCSNGGISNSSVARNFANQDSKKVVFLKKPN